MRAQEEMTAVVVAGPGETRRRGGLRPLELATAAVLAALAVAVVAAGKMLPRAGVFELLATIPMAIVAERHRPRAVMAAIVAGAFAGFLCAGTGASVVIAGCGVVGGVVGTVRRHGRGAGTVLALSLVLGPVTAGAVIGVLTAFSSVRILLIDSTRGVIAGVTGLARFWPPAAAPATWIDRFTAAALDAWQWWVFAVIVVAAPVGMLAVWWLLSAVLARLEWMITDDVLNVPAADSNAGPCAPVPVELHDVHYRYPGSPVDVLSGLNLRLAPGEFVAVVGRNGSGKSTLTRILAGAEVTEGRVRRNGPVGLGRPGGTALIAQRPETQVVGLTVHDDIVWGLPPGHGLDVDALLSEVGLAGMGRQSTHGLSGGQLQRLAIASALARRPVLLLSDESTAMIDAQGRENLLELLASLPATRGTTVIHVTHSEPESARADRVIHLGASLPTPARVRTPTARRAWPAAPVMQVRDLEHWYGYGTPWAHRALSNVSLDLHPGDGVLVTGDNGSGKSTLAWLLAGLYRPSGGVCLLDGEPVHRRRGSVALAFQHPRLQLQRPTVAGDICAAAGLRESGDELVVAALRLVGLPPELAELPIDALSGGHMRLVALAGLLAAEPRVLILDEPLAGLAPEPRRELLGAVLAHKDVGVSIVVVSHDIDHLAAVCDRRLHLEEGRMR